MKKANIISVEGNKNNVISAIVKVIDYIWNRHFIFFLALALGTAAFGLIYSFGPLNVTNDKWIAFGYDESDILAHYAGWLGYRTSDFHFPLGYAENLTYGTYISYTDSIPLIAIVSKPLLKLVGYNGTFQYFGIYVLACYILQAGAGAMLLRRKTDSKLYITMGSVIFVFSPVLMERAMRHSGLASQWIILFAIYALLKCRDNEYKKYPAAYYLLSVLAVMIHPYFLPPVMIFALVCALEGGGKTKRYFYFAANFVLTGACAALGGLAIGALGTGSKISRPGFGVFSMNLNAPFNPISLGAYTWSGLIKTRPNIDGQYDGFNYLGFGIIVFLGAVLFLKLMLGKKDMIKHFRENLVLFLAMLFMTLFAASNVIALNGRVILTLPLSQELIDLCGIFRASSRMFYAVYYCIFVYVMYEIPCIFGAIENKTDYERVSFFSKSKLTAAAMALMLLLQAFDLHSVIAEKHAQMIQKLSSENLLYDAVLEEKLNNCDTIACPFSDRLIAVAALKANTEVLFNVGVSQNFEQAAEKQTELLNELWKGNHDNKTAFVFNNAADADMCQRINDDMERYESCGYIFFFPRDNAEKNYTGASMTLDLTDTDLSYDISEEENGLLLEYSEELSDVIAKSGAVIINGKEHRILSYGIKAPDLIHVIIEDYEYSIEPVFVLFK